MDAQRFDRFARLLSGGVPRRRLLQAALLGGMGVVSHPRMANASQAILTGCRPAVKDLPNPRPTLGSPFRAVNKGDSLKDPEQCGLAIAAVGVNPAVTGGYADASGDGTHTDDFYNEYYAVDFAPAGGGSFPVLAAADGVLRRYDEPGSTNGNAVTLWIKHNDSWQTKYTHLSYCGLLGGLVDQHTLITPVKAGDQIGWAGDTGATAIHLHFELRGGDASNHTSYPSDPNGLYGNGDCCKSGNCNWSYPAPELGVTAPPPPKEDSCLGTCLSSRRKVVPGGMWEAPKNGATISSSPLRLEAHAYRANKSDPAIEHVKFTAWWAGFGSKNGPWKLLCSPTAPDHDDVYICDGDLTGAPPGPVTISFDVYDTAGNRNLAPNGTHEIVWAPESGCPNGWIKCNGECFNPKTSNEHCGTCGNQCGIFSICCSGDCGCDNTSIIPFYCMGATVLCAPA